MDKNGKYCDDCVNIVGTPIGCYCKITGKNLDRESYFSHDQKDHENLMQHCKELYKSPHQ